MTWEPDTQVAAVKVKALDVWTGAFKGKTGKLVLLLERTEGGN